MLVNNGAEGWYSHTISSSMHPSWITWVQAGKYITKIYMVGLKHNDTSDSSDLYLVRYFQESSFKIGSGSILLIFVSILSAVIYIIHRKKDLVQCR